MNISRPEEALRVRQVRKYLSLPNNGRNDIKRTEDVTSTKVTSPNTTLTAFTQLLTWRFDAERAIISLVDSDHQYFLAESTPGLDLDGPQEEWLWAGCSGSTSRGNALCDKTIEALAKSDESFAIFRVEDLKSHPEFCSMPYVEGQPGFRYYCGTPLIR